MYEAFSSEEAEEEESDGERLYSSSSNRVFDETLGSSPIVDDESFD